MPLDSLNASELQAIGAQLTNDSSKYENRADVEYQWAVKAYHHAETYSNLISSVDPKVLKLTRLDDDIYKHFRGEFPDLNVKELDVDFLKTPEQKEKWRKFCMQYDQQQVQDFNLGTLIRINSREEFSEQNSTLVVRIQFLAIEIARNREGHNDNLQKKHVPS
ncbi:PBDC1-like protein [Mya arenaria]|uniref:PBDC1-like protein n=1 Tax=Mya arenaria TaxID=6604 RepID=A0ABY7FNL5_MYAAR|nr:protein PBDC1-like [Mya arenaria]XP_052772956.1 protein PBDC1-like [Mya arenaria]WAR20816.1 PBDC1-like protein [Mya arenaria]